LASPTPREDDRQKTADALETAAEYVLAALEEMLDAKRPSGWYAPYRGAGGGEERLPVVAGRAWTRTRERSAKRSSTTRSLCMQGGFTSPGR
jgi:hypothetical protein